MDFKTQCMNIKFEIDDSKLCSRDCEISTAYMLIDQFNSEVDDIQKQAQVCSFDLFVKLILIIY